MIVVLEGGEAVGKATHAKRFVDRGFKLFSFPRYETEVGRILKGHLIGNWTVAALGQPGQEIKMDIPEDQFWLRERRQWDRTNMLVRQALMTIDRYAAAAEIEEAAKHSNVILDRYYLSGVVYGTIEGLDTDWLYAVHARLPQPDVSILLDAPVEEGFKRRPQRRDNNERDREKLEKVRLEYLRAFGFDTLQPARDKLFPASEWTSAKARHYVVQAVGTIEEVADRIDAAIGHAFGQKVSTCAGGCGATKYELLTQGHRKGCKLGEAMP